jgi:hypothetical protein
MLQLHTARVPTGQAAGVLTGCETRRPGVVACSVGHQLRTDVTRVIQLEDLLCACRHEIECGVGRRTSDGLVMQRRG